MRILVAVLMMGLTAGAQARVKCSQFATQAEAQAYMQKHGARYLDRDHDGIACEHLAGGKRHAKKSAKKHSPKAVRSAKKHSPKAVR